MNQINNFINFKNVSYCYQNSHKNKACEALHNINLSIKKGEFIAILGLNGCGKSTLAKHLGGVLVPISGDVLIDNKNTKDEVENLNIKRKVGLIFQNPNNQIVSSVVEEEVAFGLENLGVPTEEMRSIVDKTLKSVGLYQQKHSVVSSLSGGQKQRLAIAGVLAMNPDVIVFDEPTSMLEPAGRKDVMNIILNLNISHGTTIVFITHYVEEALFADRVIIMNKGRIEVIGKPREILSRVDFIENKKFEIMQSTELLYRLKKQGYEVALNIFTDTDCAGEIIKLLEGNNA